MIGKFTIRDFIVYFFNGFMFFTAMAFIHYDAAISFFNKYKDLSAFWLFGTVPFFYVTGHIIMGIEYSVMSRIGRRINQLKNRYNNRFTRLLNTIIFEYSALGIKTKFWKEEYGDYLEECVILEKNGEYNKAEYWELISDLNKGFVLTFIISTGLGLYYHNIKVIIGCVILLFICWDRARLFATFHIQAVINRVKANRKTLVNQVDKKPTRKPPRAEEFEIN